MPRGINRNPGDGVVDKNNSIIRMNKKFSMPQGASGLDAMRAEVNAKLGSRDKGPSLADLRSVIGNSDNAPAGGMKRPEMESCSNCGTQTPKGSGSCADCK